MSATDTPTSLDSRRVSIVIATRQAAATLEQCLLSTIEQDFTAWELLIADAGSTDGSVDIIRKYEAQIAWWQSRPDTGIYDAWNQALQRARGEYVCFLGADDAWTDCGALSRLFAAAGDVEYDLITSRGINFDPETGKSVIHGSAWDYDRIGRRMIVCHPGLLHRRSLFETYGMFDIRYRIAADLDFLLRLPADIKTLHVDTPSVLIRAGGLSRRQVFLRLREQRAVLARCPRYGTIRAYLVWADKLARLPIARVFRIPH